MVKTIGRHARRMGGKRKRGGTWANGASFARWHARQGIASRSARSELAREIRKHNRGVKKRAASPGRRTRSGRSY